MSIALSAVACVTSTTVIVGSGRATGYLVGLVLQLIGVVMALRGLGDLSRELGRRALPHQSAWSWIKRQLRIKPRPKHVVLGTATANLGGVGHVRAFVTKPRPHEAAPASEWNAYWDSQLNAIGSQIVWLKQDIKQGHAELRQLVSEEASARAIAESQLEDRFRTLVVGREGKGLVETWWGIAAATVGTVLTGVTGWPT